MFLLYFQVEDSQKILKLRCRPFAITSCKILPKNKKRSRTSSPALFSALLFLKNFFTLDSINWSNFIIVLLRLLPEISGNKVIEFICFPVWDVIQFATSWTLKFKFAFLSSCFPTWAGENVRRKIYRSSERKEF